MAARFWQHVRATNDVNGNPRRCFVIFDGEDGSIVGVVDEGFEGLSCRKELEGLVELPGYCVSVTEYNNLIKFGDSLS